MSQMIDAQHNARFPEVPREICLASSRLGRVLDPLVWDESQVPKHATSGADRDVLYFGDLWRQMSRC
jgi:hypothetical protein